MISVVQLEALDYDEGLRLQNRLLDLRKAGEIGDVLLLLEHTPVITLGRNAKAGHVLASTEALAARGVAVFECDRGGDVTFHGPGQLVGYPILDLRAYDRPPQADPGSPLNPSRKTLGVVDYIRRLEEVLIRSCSDFGIGTKRIAGLTGVWTDPEDTELDRGTGAADGRRERKIAAIGVHVSRSVTSHGFALNVNTDLDYFRLIVPCGIAAKPVTSMQQELQRELDLNRVAQSVSRNFGSMFGSQMLWVENLDALLRPRVGIPMRAPAELRRVRGEDELFLA
ncbi:MAG: lipoyl(octanoyl) transferase LipB [Terriglobales bacterium]|jgi:lipoyl(octanoyl) transferase